MEAKKTDKRLVVLGGGESGVGAALLAQQKGWEVFVSDFGQIKDAYKQELKSNNISFEEGKHSLDKIYTAQEVVKSPGIPDTVPIVKGLVEKGIPVISEIELAARYTQAKIIGITGSNGKTTTTVMIGHILQSAGLNVGVAGNVGKSFARFVAEAEPEYWVIELSSFQLDGIRDFCPDVALLLNITPDHLDRYNSNMDEYIASKFRIAMNLQKEDAFLFAANDDNIKKGWQDTPAKKFALDWQQIDNEQIHDEYGVFDIANTKIRGIHNAMNALFAIRTALLCGLSRQQIEKGLATFSPVEHRLESIRVIDGVEFINDSKATNVDAAKYALMAIKKPMVWVVGGQDKGNDYSLLFDLVKEKVKAIVCLGADNTKIKEAFAFFDGPFVETQTAVDAAQQAQKMAERGMVVLLAPACASFDLFNNYEHRGHMFKAAVNDL